MLFVRIFLSAFKQTFKSFCFCKYFLLIHISVQPNNYISTQIDISLTLPLSLMDPLPRMDIFTPVSSCNRFMEFPRGPSSFPTKLNCDTGQREEVIRLLINAFSTQSVSRGHTMRNAYVKTNLSKADSPSLFMRGYKNNSICLERMLSKICLLAISYLLSI